MKNIVYNRPVRFIRRPPFDTCICPGKVVFCELMTKRQINIVI